jgi:hypothetical protein
MLLQRQSASLTPQSVVTYLGFLPDMEHGKIVHTLQMTYPAGQHYFAPGIVFVNLANRPGTNLAF